VRGCLVLGVLIFNTFQGHSYGRIVTRASRRTPRAVDSRDRDEENSSFVSTLATLAASLLRNSYVLTAASSAVWDEVASRHLLLNHLSLKMDQYNEHIVC
jgi:hypothetical protein